MTDFLLIQIYPNIFKNTSKIMPYKVKNHANIRNITNNKIIPLLLKIKKKKTLKSEKFR